MTDNSHVFSWYFQIGALSWILETVAQSQASRIRCLGHRNYAILTKIPIFWSDIAVCAGALSWCKNQPSVCHNAGLFDEHSCAIILKLPNIRLDCRFHRVNKLRMNYAIDIKKANRHDDDVVHWLNVALFLFPDVRKHNMFYSLILLNGWSIVCRQLMIVRNDVCHQSTCRHF